MKRFLTIMAISACAIGGGLAIDSTTAPPANAAYRTIESVYSTKTECMNVVASLKAEGGYTFHVPCSNLYNSKGKIVGYALHATKP